MSTLVILLLFLCHSLTLYTTDPTVLATGDSSPPPVTTVYDVSPVHPPIFFPGSPQVTIRISLKTPHLPRLDHLPDGSIYKVLTGIQV